MTIQQDSFPKAILFDMDGVLIDSQDAWWKAINVALTRSNNQTITKQEFISNLWGNDFKKTISYLDVKENIFLGHNDWTTEYLKHIILANDAVSTLETLQELYSLGLITNTDRFVTKQVLKRFQLTSFFNVIVCADDVQRGKPSPDIIYHACKSLNVSVSDVIVIGDTRSDFLACQQAGCHMIGINFDDHGHSIKHLSEIPHFISQLKKDRA